MTKVPKDASLSPEMRRFHDDESRRLARSLNRIFIVRDEKAANTAGGTFTQGADRTRTINTVVVNTIAGASLASDQITLPAGTFLIVASAPGHLTGQHRAWLYNVSDSATTILGTSEYTLNTSGGNIQTRSWVVGAFTIAASKTFEIRHRCAATRATDGYGIAVNFNSANEVYTTALIWKVA